jgi:hypothetical protein
MTALMDAGLLSAVQVRETALTSGRCSLLILEEKTALKPGRRTTGYSTFHKPERIEYAIADRC